MTNVPHTTTFVLLAAGAGQRFAGPVHKLLAEINGSPVISLALGAMVRAGGGDCVVITGAEQSPALLSLIEPVPTVVNEQWRTGQRSSVLAAIEIGRAHV